MILPNCLDSFLCKTILGVICKLSRSERIFTIFTIFTIFIFYVKNQEIQK